MNLLAALFAITSLFAGPPAAATPKPLRVGVTLHPYYSWVKNIAGDVPGVEVRPLLPAGVDAGNYQPSPRDLKRLRDLDAIVVNGNGHDDFIFDMIKASGNRRVVIIRPNEATPLLRNHRGTGVNSHTFLSFTNAVQQTYFIAKALGALRPEHAEAFQKNASDYARRLRRIKADAASRLADAKVSRVVTVHDGYSYLLHELGIEVVGVVEPTHAHGLVPSARELEDMVALLRKEKVGVVLSEVTFPDKLLGILRESAGVRVYIISHIATGPYTAEQFEQEMTANADALVKALVTDPK